MNREEFIGKLQLCYFGDRNAFNEIVSVYDGIKESYIEEGINGQWTNWKFEAENNKRIYEELQRRIDKAVKVINTQMKLAEDGVKENLRIIKFYLIKGECSVYDLITEEDYKY